MRARPETLKGRMAARIGDASDATTEVIETQLGYDLGNMTWNRMT